MASDRCGTQEKEAFKKEMSHLLVHHDLKGLQKLSSTLQPKKERDNLYQNFDQIFLSLFPHFVRDFNTLLKPDAHIQLKKDDQLTPELRIFALKKMGIHDQETIAHILNYSINTIYTYRTKIKNKSRYSLDEIDHKIILF